MLVGLAILLSGFILLVCFVLVSLCVLRRVRESLIALSELGKQKPKIDQRLVYVGELQVGLAMVRQGWRPWPANATEDERYKAFEAYLTGEVREMYPPSYEEPPLVTEGKLEVIPMQGREERRSWWKRW